MSRLEAAEQAAADTKDAYGSAVFRLPDFNRAFYSRLLKGLQSLRRAAQEASE